MRNGLTKAKEAQDPIGVFLDGTQYANDANGQRLTAISSYVRPPDAITPPNSDTSYPDSSPPLLFGVPATSGSHTLVLAVCDFSDESYDTGFMINIQGCTDCNQPIKINYVTTTTTVSANVATSTTSTIPASGTVSGTYIVTVQAEPVTTTTAESTTTTTEADTTTTAEVESTTKTQSDTETTTLDMSTTTTSSTSTKESTTSSIETTESTPTTTATETIPRTEESTTSLKTQSPIIGSTTTSVTIPNVATTTTATETESGTESASSEEVIESTTSAGPLPSTITSMEVSGVSTAPSSTIDQTASQSSVGARNLRTIDQYVYTGCLGSIESFPSFREVATVPDMTTEICVGLAAGSNYVGIYQQSYYAADSLTGAVLVPNDRCDLLRPGNPTLFCGGNVGETQRRRAISSSQLLTLYKKQADVSISSGLSSATDEITSSGPAITSLSLNPTFATETSLSLSTEPAIIIPTSTEDRLPLTYPTIRTVHLTKGFNYTRTAAANTVTTVTYITVHPNNPGYLITTQVPVPLGYTPCNCDHQVYPPVDMTTIVTACHACGANGENSVTLVVPTAACEAGVVKPGYPHEVSYSAHKITEVNSFAGPKPTMGQYPEPLPVHGSPKPNSQGKPQPSRSNAPRPVNAAPDASAVIQPPRPLPTSAYQVPASKAWTTEQHAPGQIHKPEATQVSYPAAPWDGQSTSTPLVVASATRQYLMPWTVAGVVFSVAFFLA